MQSTSGIFDNRTLIEMDSKSFQKLITTGQNRTKFYRIIELFIAKHT